MSECSETIYHRPRARPQASAPSSVRCAAGGSTRVTYVVAALRLHVEVDVGEARDGGWRHRSGRPAPDPSPAAHGPSAYCRRRRAGAIWSSAVVAHALDG